MGAPNQKPKGVGSAYINVAKESPQELQDELNGIIQFLTENKAYLSISILRADGQYAKLTGFFNEYKRSDKDPDIIIRNSLKATQTKQSGGYAKKSYGQGKPTGYQKPAPQAQAAPAPQQAQESADEFGGEGVPF